MQKGQASLEFLFLILIVIVYITTTIIPLTSDASSAVGDVDSIAKANNEAQKIVNSIERVFSFGEGTKETITVFIPANTTLFCNTKTISFQTTLTARPYPAQCTSGTCTKSLNVPSSVSMDCRLPTIVGPTKGKVIIEKSTDNNVIFTQG